MDEMRVPRNGPGGGGSHKSSWFLKRRVVVFAVVLLVMTVFVAPSLVSAVKAIFVSADKIVDVQVGDEGIKQVYIGDKLVWEIKSLQEMSIYDCTTSRDVAYDARDGQRYYVQKMADGKCWMLSNLRYAGGGNNQWGDSKTLSLVSGSNASSFTTAQYADPNGHANYTATNSAGGFYGYLYNWCAAMGGQASACNNTSTSGFNTSISICPAGWRLPTGGSGGEFQTLNNTVNGGSTTSTAGLVSNWLGMYSGFYFNGLFNQGGHGGYWSSTVGNANDGHSLYFYSGNVFPGMGYSGKSTSLAVRCVKEMPVAPQAAVPNNISSTNPAVIDVYPTTGWTNDVVTISSNAMFTNVQGVKIGGADCDYRVISTSAIACRLPPKAHGSANEIAVMNGSTNVTNASTYTHMIITYFNPGSSTVNMAGTDYQYFANGFTSANCAALTPSNSLSANLPGSVAYFRDTRNNQVYKVKRMIDNKCHMIDNLKYLENTVSNVDGTKGMIYNNKAATFNTVYGTDAHSAANIDKAFYNNPMGQAACYGGSASVMASNTLTHCGYLYNWYAATRGTGTYNWSTAGSQVTTNICPVNFRLPSSQSGAGGATVNGTAMTAADFTVLNASMLSGSLQVGNTTTNATSIRNWLPDGPYQGTLSGSYYNSFNLPGVYAAYRSSTTASAHSVYYVNSSASNVYPVITSFKYEGLALRCVVQ